MSQMAHENHGLLATRMKYTTCHSILHTSPLNEATIFCHILSIRD